MRRCRDCGSDFVGWPQARLCPDCRSRRKLERLRERYATDSIYRERKRAATRRRQRDPAYWERQKERYHNDPVYREQIKTASLEWYYRRHAVDIVERRYQRISATPARVERRREKRRQYNRRNQDWFRFVRYMREAADPHYHKERQRSRVRRHQMGTSAVINALRDLGWIPGALKGKRGEPVFQWTCETCQREKPCSRFCTSKRNIARQRKNYHDRRSIINAMRELGWLKGYEIQLLPAPTPTQENLLAMILSGGKNDANE